MITFVVTVGNDLMSHNEHDDRKIDSDDWTTIYNEIAAEFDRSDVSNVTIHLPDHRRFSFSRTDDGYTSC